MKIKTIKILRSKIDIPLNKAIEFLKKYDGDILLCEQEFHKVNIEGISKITDCTQEEATRIYKKLNYNIEKTIKQINEKDIVFTIDNRCIPKNYIGFILYPVNKEGKYYKTTKRNDAFIPSEDFELIIEIIKSVFPLKNRFNNLEKEFDVRGLNSFNKRICFRLMEQIENISCKNSNEEIFLTKIIKWFKEKLVYADYIVIDGNL